MILTEVYVSLFKRLPRNNGKWPETTANISETEETNASRTRIFMHLCFLSLSLSEMFICQRFGIRQRVLAGSPRHTLNRRPHAARHCRGGGGVLRCYFNTMYVCIYRKTDAPQLYLFPLKRHATRVTWATAYAPVPRRRTIQTWPSFVWVGHTSFHRFGGWLAV